MPGQRTHGAAAGWYKKNYYAFFLIHAGKLPGRNYSPDFYISCLARIPEDPSDARSFWHMVCVLIKKIVAETGDLAA